MLDFLPEKSGLPAVLQIGFEIEKVNGEMIHFGGKQRLN
jgi:hypothetical protein